MVKEFENKGRIGEGIYTLPDIAQIFNIPYYKVSKWVKEYWDVRLANSFENQYSWTDGMARAISFHTLIELFVFMRLSDAGVRTKDILMAHQKLSSINNTKFPTLQKKNKTPNTQARQKSTQQMTITDDIKMVVTQYRQELQPITAVILY